MNIDKVNRYLILNDKMLLTLQKIYKDIQNYFIFDLSLSFSDFVERLNNDFILIKNTYNNPNQYKMLNKLVIGNTYIYDNGYKCSDAIFLGCLHMKSNNQYEYDNIFHFGLKSNIKNDYCIFLLNKLYLIKDKYEY